MLAVKLERELPKQEILERYLNTIYFGRGAYGVQAASRAYFGKDVERPRPARGGLPGRADPLAGDGRRQPRPDDPQAATSRDGHPPAHVGARRHARGGLHHPGSSTTTWPRAGFGRRAGPAKPVQLRHDLARPELGTEYFVDYVQHVARARASFTEAEIYGGGLRVYTTLDYDMQQAPYDAVTSTLDRPDDPAAALVAVDDQGQVRAMVGGRDYADVQGEPGRRH